MKTETSKHAKHTKKRGIRKAVKETNSETLNSQT